MTVNDLINNSEFTPITLPDKEREITGVYAGDLLSWVMGKAKSNDAWITIMSNVNVLAVASLADVACVILAEGVVLEDEVLKTATEKNINVFSTKMDIYNTSVYLNKLL